MRRIIHNTTAIAACLSILAPNVAGAEARIANDVAANRMAEQTEAQPNRAATLQEELQAGLGVDQLLCADGSDRPCADGTELVTPAGLTVDVSENGQIVLSGRARQGADEPLQLAQAKLTEEERAARRAAKQAERGKKDADGGKAAAKDGPTDEQRAERRAARQAERAAEEKAAEKPAKADKGPSEAERAERRAARQAERAADDKAKTDASADDGPSEAERAERRAARQAERDEAERNETDGAAQLTDDQRAVRRAARQAERAGNDAQDDASGDSLAKALAAEKASGSAAAGAPAKGRVELATSETAQDRDTAMTPLSRVLSGEVEEGLDADDLACLSGAAAPCAPGDPLVTPRGVVVEANPNGRIMLAPAERQMFRATAEGELRPRAAEEGTVETEGSRQAAQERRAPDNAALNAGERQGRVTEERVTRENRRSSSEDFQTSLRDALDNRNGRQADNDDDDDDDNKLAKALLLGLGAVAVGAMLNNNRQVALSSPDRVVVTRPDGSQEVIRDEVALLRQPGATVTTENFDDGSSRTIVTREDGSRVVTIRDADLRVLRRTLISADGTSTALIDDTTEVEPVDIADLPEPAPLPNLSNTQDEAALREALRTETDIGRSFTLGQVRSIPEVRALVAPVNIDAITFDTGSAAINPDQARQLSGLGSVIQDAILDNPREIFLIEGYTDTVGEDAANLALSDRRAESVALALTEYFDVPPENLVAQGYGEQFLRVRAEGDIRDNRRASVRRITDLLQTASLD